MRTFVALIIAAFTTSSALADTVKCKVTPNLALKGEKTLEIRLDDTDNLTVFGDFSVKVESDPNKSLIIVLIDSKRGALATAPINPDTKEGRVQVGVVDRNWVFLVTGTAECKLQ